MNIYKDFKKDPKAVAGKLVHIISIVTFGIIAINRSDILTAPALDEKINGDDSFKKLNGDEDSLDVKNMTNTSDESRRLLEVE